MILCIRLQYCTGMKNIEVRYNQKKLIAMASTLQRSMSEAVEFLIKRFPLYREKILHEYHANEDFKTLCDDFYTSALIVQRQKKATIKNKKNELEYQKLFFDLEFELVNFLGLKKSDK
jgi:hypothetical protein